MTLIDLIGWAAAALTLLAFTLRDVCLLRTASPGAGVAFTVYAGVMATWRMLVLRLFGTQAGRGCRIYGSAKVWDPANLVLGDNVLIGPGAFLYNQ